MKKQFTISLLASSLIISSAFAESSSSDRFEKIEKEMSALKTEVNILKTENSKLSSKLVSSTSSNGDNLKWGVDFRTSVDSINYKMANGTTQSNDALLSNRLWLNMSYEASENVKFGGQLAYNKLFGQRTMINPQSAAMDSFDWVSSENKQDDTLRVRSAYIDYMNDTFFGMDVPWSFGIGRRPSNNGKLISYREDDDATSPLAHISNAEFDGGNIKFKLASVTGLEGSSFKFATGRGMSNAEARFSATPYSDASSNDTGNINMYAFNLVPYKSSKLSVEFQYTHASNLIDIKNAGFDQFGAFNPASYNPAMEKVGALELASAFVSFNGIGSGISDYLDNTIVFVSGAMSKTDPDSAKAMLGSMDSENGYSYWIGTQMPSLISEKGKWGIEFNHGSKYWRSFTYAEDTAIGSKVAARGDVYEVYFTEPLVDSLSFQVRYTYIDYDYTGSNGFFGSQSGTPMKISDLPASTDIAGVVVDKAQDIRVYLRYKF
ncbi:DUF3373 family protein [Candidatus Sulfurimonas baltica]|uniref:DUF3373 family protein n=1 Tax=Candidatus Sulfurimonas baltica TaxID=2740404 RepID=A0A7S7LXA4_9BACT|nr:DUF3373 family protein [Candidatus Sulfurimonas baltica]QOY53229.1 DUF3373 family protein [Candidatus Sulfurimonas baltica]